MAEFTFPTLKPILKEVTDECFLWCKNQHFYRMQNIVADNMSPVIVALISLFIFYLTTTYSEFILKYTKIEERYLIIISESAFYFTLYLLAIYVVYLSFFVA